MNPLAILAIFLVAAMPMLGQTITGVSPTTAAQGTANVLVTCTLGRNPPPPPIAAGQARETPSFPCCSFEAPSMVRTILWITGMPPLLIAPQN